MAEFAVGEVAIYWPPFDKCRGEEVTVIGSLRQGYFSLEGQQINCDCYPVAEEPWMEPKADPAGLRACPMGWLRKKDRDVNTVISWADCPEWRPAEYSFLE